MDSIDFTLIILIGIAIFFIFVVKLLPKIKLMSWQTLLKFRK